MEDHRRELTAYCYRMLGSAFEAEDAVQETLQRAWRSFDRFERPAALRSWLYRIATNVCLTLLDGRDPRARPMDLGPPSPADSDPGSEAPESAWIGPIPDSHVLPEDVEQAELTIARETIGLAYLAALQHLPPRERAVLILREVLAWKAGEVADLLGTTVASISSALEHASSTLATGSGPSSDPPRPLNEEQRALVAHFATAFEHHDIESLVALLHRDVAQTMAPYEMWLQGPGEIARWMAGPGSALRGSRLIPVRANGSPGFGHYRPAGPARHEPWALHVLELSGDRIIGINSFLNTTSLFPLFGLPPSLEP